MHFRVYPMRQHGRRLPWREIENGPSYVGALISHTTRHGESTYSVLALQSGNPAEKEKPLPDLYEPALVLFAPNAFVLRGYERLETPEGAVGVVQEWHCRDE
jgi:hypothetical protein